MTDSYADRDAEDGYSALLRTIEGEVIPRLILAHRAVADGNRCDDLASPLLPGSTEIFELARIVLRGSNAEALAYLRGLQTLGMNTETIYLELLAPVARHLGVRWEDESSDFVEVTLGLQKLQDLAHQLSEANVETSRPTSRVSRRALFAALPGEQHVFGSQLVGEFLRGDSGEYRLQHERTRAARERCRALGGASGCCAGAVRGDPVLDELPRLHGFLELGNALRPD